MFITRKADYAVRCVLYLAKNKDQATINEISQTMNIPKTFLAKILQQLIKAGIVSSERGIKGGFKLIRAPEKISLLDIIEVIQGQSAINTCAIEAQKCKLSNQCPVHPVWVKLRVKIEKELKAMNFKKLSGN